MYFGGMTDGEVRCLKGPLLRMVRSEITLWTPLDASKTKISLRYDKVSKRFEMGKSSPKGSYRITPVSLEQAQSFVDAELFENIDTVKSKS